MVLVTWKEFFSHFFFNPSGCRENLKAVIPPNSGLRFAIQGPMKQQNVTGRHLEVREEQFYSNGIFSFLLERPET